MKAVVEEGDDWRHLACDPDRTTKAKAEAVADSGRDAFNLVMGRGKTGKVLFDLS